MDDDQHDSESFDSAVSDPDYSTSEVNALIEKAVSAATKDFADQLSIQRAANAELTAKLQALTDTTEDTLNLLREQTRLEKLQLIAQGQAAQLQRHLDVRTGVIADIELVMCEAEDLALEGKQVPRSTTIKHRQLNDQLSKIQAQIVTARTCLVNTCQQLGTDISDYIHEE